MSHRLVAPVHATVRLVALALVVLTPVVAFARPAGATPDRDRALHGYADVATNDFGATESWAGSLRLYPGIDQTGEPLAAYCIERGLAYPRGTDPDLADANSGFSVIGDVPRERGVSEIERGALAYALWRYGDTTDDQTAAAMFLLTHLQSGDPDFGSDALGTTTLGADWPTPDAAMARAVQIRDESLAHRGPWTMTVDVTPAEGTTMVVTATLRGPGGPIRDVDVVLATDNADGDGTARTDAEGRVVRTVTATDLAAPVRATAKRTTTPAYYRVFEGRVGTQRVITSGGDGVPVSATDEATVPRGGVRIVKTSTNPAYQSGAGAVFEVRHGGPDGDVAGIIRIGPDGTGAALDLLAGRYAVIEVEAPVGQRLDPTVTTVDIGPGQTAVVERTNATIDEGAIRLVKTDGDTGEVLVGAAFEVRFDADADGTYETPIGTEPWITTGSIDDPVTITGLAAGRYQVVEVRPPPGYTRPEPDVGSQVVELDIGATATVGVENRRPLLSTQVLAQGEPVTVVGAGATVADRVQIDNVASTTTGSVTARLHGPFATDAEIDCTDATVFDQSVFETAGSGTFTSPDVILTEPGIYTYVDTAAFDDGSIATHGCGEATETVSVPGITTAVSDAVVTVGQPVSDVALLTGVRDGQVGRIETVAYGPFPSVEAIACDASVEVFRVSDEVTGSGSFESPAFEPAVAGIYTFVETWTSADGSASATHPCGEAAETVVVNPAVVTQVSLPTAIVGESIFDRAVLVGPPADMAGEVDFTLYGPFGAGEAPTCGPDRAVSTATVPTQGPGAIESPPLTVTEPGTYTYIATWRSSSGSLRATHGCALAAETSTVVPPGPTSVPPRPIRPASTPPGPGLAETGTTSLPMTLLGLVALLMGVGGVAYAALDERRRFRDYWTAARMASRR